MALCESSPVRILLVSDLHYELRQFDWVLSQASAFEIVVLAGDLLDIASVVPLEAQVPVVLGYLERLAGRATTIVCSGNHDLSGRDENGEKSARWLARAADFGAVIDYSSTTLDGVLITVCPWWDGPHGRARVEAFLTEQRELAPDRWIWVYHWPPPDCPVSWTGSRSYGDADLAGWIERFHPSLVLAGHVHQAPLARGGSWVARSHGTWVVNVGHQIGPTPSHAVIDLDTWAAHWWSFEESADHSLV